MQEITTRFATKADIPVIMNLIMELATYEKLPNEVKTREKDFEENWNSFVVILAENSEETVGMAFMFHCFSTWVGKMCHLEDLVVREKYRRLGIGDILFMAVIDYSNDQKFNRLKWEVLDWNEPAIEFYKKYDAHFEKSWLTCRLKKNQLDKFKIAND